jgi:beta-glucosidase
MEVLMRIEQLLASEVTAPSAGALVKAASGLLVLLVTSICALQAGQAERPPSPMTDAQVEARVKALLEQMTLQEKVGQLTQLFAFGPAPEDRIRKGEIGSLLFIKDPAVTNHLQRIAVQESRARIPILFGYDVIHGFRTLFPVPIGMAASWDPALIEEVQTVAAREASSAGVRWTFGPMVDIARDARWGRMVEGAGEDPYLGSLIAAAQVRGFQGPYAGSPEHVLACAKHYAGYGAAEGGRDYDSTYLPEVLLRNVYLRPFHAAEQAGCASFMSAYQDVNDIPASANRFLLDQVLRQDWGFKGFVVSDAYTVATLVDHGFARDPADAATRALTAGVDMDMGSNTYWTQLAKLVDEGKLPQSMIDLAAGRILAAKVRLGLFENPYVDEARAQKVMSAPAHRELAREAAQRSAVLLRNEGQLLPLSRNQFSSLAVIGPLADSQTDTVGSWAMSGDAKDAITILQGIRAKVAGVRVEYAQGAQLRRLIPSFFDDFLPGPKPAAWSPEQSEAEFQKAVETARGADACVMVLGEAQNMSGEVASRASLDLPGRQEELLKAVVALGKPVVLVLMSGRPLDLVWASEHVPAILQVWYPGVEGGAAVADLLFGDAVPGGKLPVSWARSAGQLPLYYNHNLTHQPETAPNFKSRYWDSLSSPLYPFGYGLSYTTFEYSNLRVDAAQIKIGESCKVSVDLMNSGTRPGVEVAQLYIHQRAGSASRPIRELKGFRRVSLKPGEKATVEFTLGPDELRFWSPQAKAWVEEAEEFDIWVGGDSRAPLHGELKVTP